MGCGHTKDGTSHAIRERAVASTPDISSFHDTFILDQKVVQSCFGQINLAHKVAKFDESLYRPSEQSRPFPTLLRRQSSASVEALVEVVEYTAVKIVDVRMKGSTMLKLMQNEISFLSSLKHEKHVMELRDVFRSKDLCYMVMESCIGSFLNYMQAIAVINERTLGEAFCQMLMGIKCLHSMHVVHRGLKPDNFLVGIEDGKKTIKLCDFTLATTLIPGGPKLHGECGSPLFMCPEMVTNRGYDAKADVWSLGIIVYGLVFGRLPFNHREKSSQGVKDTVAMGNAISFKSALSLSSSCIAFSMVLLENDPDRRPSSTEALQKTYMIDSIAGNHLTGKRLPDLRPMLQAVKQLRSFEYHDPNEKSNIDDVLNRHQLERHGRPLPKVNTTSLVVGQIGSAKDLESVKKLEKRNSSTAATVSSDVGSYRKQGRFPRASTQCFEYDSDGESICSV